MLAMWVGLHFSPVIAGILRWRGDPDRGPKLLRLFLLDTFLGWTFIGWAAAWGMVFPEIGTVRPMGTLGGHLPPSGLFDAPQGQPRVCSQCHGTGMMTCPVCQGMGRQADCQYCLRSGRVQCTATHSS